MIDLKKENNGIRKKLFKLVLLPIIIFGFFIVMFGMAMLYRSYVQGIQDELKSMTDIMIGCLDFAIDGDYSYRNNSLYKGDLNITDSTILNHSKEKSDIDTTIFWQDIRIITTVENEHGVSAVGTKANPKVVQAVLKEGKTYYSDNLDINGIKYIGFYTPLTNSDNSIIGMVFAGKNKKLVYNKLTGFLIGFMLFGLISVLIAFSLSKSFSGRMVKDINIINKFLKEISEGDLNTDLDRDVQHRNDELGSIGLYAVKMRENLKNMIERDPLTTLFNRRSINKQLKLLEQRNARFSIVMCDIDWFKKVNDTYGHDAGDYILVTISGIIRENVKNCGFAGRWGGEEFLLIYRLGEKETIKKVEDIKKKIEAYDFNYDNQKINITMTFGIESNNEKEPYEKRIKKADDRLYIGKSSGRNIIIYKEDEKAG